MTQDAKSGVTDRELELSTVLGSLLQLREVDLNLPFIAVGGDSLVATRLMTQLSDLHKVDLSPILPFDARTLRELAAEIGRRVQRDSVREFGIL